MSYVPCRGCIEKGRQPPCYVPDANQVCCDCWLPTPQERERELDRLRTSLDCAYSTQRDRFAEAAIAAGKAPNEAWDTADTMMELRGKTYRERQLLALCVECPRCGAEPDQPCKTDNDYLRFLHPERLAAVSENGRSDLLNEANNKSEARRS